MTRRVETFGWLAGDGEMSARMRAKDWRATPLGPSENWPQNIKTATNQLGARTRLEFAPEGVFRRVATRLGSRRIGGGDE